MAKRGKKAQVAPASGSGRHEPAATVAPLPPPVGDNLSRVRSGSGYGGSVGNPNPKGGNGK